MNSAPGLLHGFASRRIATAGGHIDVATAGTGPALLLLHGYPETRLAWHRVAHALARQHTVVAADLRGCGDSACPPTDAAHRPYAKRAMAAEMRGVMGALGHARFAVAGHDRGGRVAYRLALDHPDTVTQLIAIDILTTLDQWAVMAPPLSRPMQHWPLLAQPAPIPETLIAADSAGWVNGRLRRGTRHGTLAPFHTEALSAYRRAFADPDRVHATCEDFRAGAGIDADDDRADRAAGRRILCPTLVVMASHGSLVGLDDPLALWRPWCAHVTGAGVESGHFVPEEAPDALLSAVTPFLGNA